MSGLESSGAGNFRDWVRGNWIGWVDGREPAGGRGQRRSGWGSGRGAPDLTLGVQLKVLDRQVVILLPAELKRAKFTHGTKLVSQSAVNVDQVKWHRDAAARGILTAFIWGVASSNLLWKSFIMKPNNGWAEEGEYLELPAESMAFQAAVVDWVRGQLKL